MPPANTDDTELYAYICVVSGVKTKESGLASFVDICAAIPRKTEDEVRQIIEGLIKSRLIVCEKGSDPRNPEYRQAHCQKAETKGRTYQRFPRYVRPKALPE